MGIYGRQWVAAGFKWFSPDNLQVHEVFSNPEELQGTGEIQNRFTGRQVPPTLADMWRVEEILAPDERRKICADIIATLPDWFGIETSNAGYIDGCGSKLAFVVRGDDDQALGMLSLAHAYPTNADIYWIGLPPEHHRKGIGEALFGAALARAKELGCETMTVETLSDKDRDKNYARTRAFYDAMGFKTLFELRPNGDINPMIYMLRQL